jgi:hypothetical protein
MDDNAKTDWYVFADIENPSQDQVVLIEAILSQRGEKAKYSMKYLSSAHRVLFKSSGGLDQITEDLDALGDSQRDLRNKVQLN